MGHSDVDLVYRDNGKYRYTVSLPSDLDLYTIGTLQAISAMLQDKHVHMVRKNLGEVGSDARREQQASKIKIEYNPRYAYNIISYNKCMLRS